MEERDGVTALWAPRGIERVLPVDAEGREIRIPQDDWTLATRATTEETLALVGPGRSHSVWLMWDEERRFSHWYVNFEQPLGRTALGFDYEDWKLDLIVGRDIVRASDTVPFRPPGRAHDLQAHGVSSDAVWHWKDEDELEEAARRGIVDADAVWAEAERVLSDPPWPTGWEDWRPDPSWPTPRFPDGWDAVL